jgi:hypothetical protein
MALPDLNFQNEEAALLQHFQGEGQAIPIGRWGIPITKELLIDNVTRQGLEGIVSKEVVYWNGWMGGLDQDVGAAPVPWQVAREALGKSYMPLCFGHPSL